MAKVLAHNLVKGSSELQTAKENGQSAIDFLANLSSNIASAVPGAHADLKELPWRKLPLIPVSEEIKKPRLRIDDLPVIRKKGKYQSEADYLNTYFRLLREDCFFKLRKGISEFVENGQKFDARDMMMYRISLRYASTCHENSPTVMLIALEYEVLCQSQDSNKCENTDWLMYGNLLCISLDDSFQKPVWAVVDRHIPGDRIVKVTLCEKANVISEPQFIARMQEMTNKEERAFMAESQTFYLAYAPPMEVLQHRDHVPFKEFLVYPDSKYMKPAEYISKIKRPPDWGIIFHKDSLPETSHKDETSADYSLLDDFEEMQRSGNCKSRLDDTQLTAVELALKNKLVLIQGPPGTGKSFVGVALVRLLLSMDVPKDHGPILVVTYKNHALDNFLKDCKRTISSPGVKIVRVGRLDEDADDDLKKCLLRKVGGPWPDKLFKQKRKLMGQIWALQLKVRETFEKLRSSSIFNADMFLQEASEDQLKYLLVDNKKEKVGEEEVQKMINQRPKNKVRLKELVENALKDWLPPQKMFDCFVGEKRESLQEISSVESDQPDDQDQLENPNDFKDPSVEQKERLLATDEDIPDDEDKKIAEEEAPTSRVPTFHAHNRGCFRNLVCVDEAEVKPFVELLNTNRVWKLPPQKRVHVVYVFQSKYYSKASSEFLKVSQDYSQLHHQLEDLKNQRNIKVMKGCDIIGMTVTGAAMRANLLADIKPSVMIVEEAAEILEGQLVAVIPPSVQHLIMIGDHMQLKPVVHFHRLKKHHLDLSMFERLLNCNLPFEQLGFQCRMRDEFVYLLRELEIYEKLETNDELVRGNNPPSCVSSSMYFWTHTEWESESNTHSKRNSQEASKITEVAKTFCQEGAVDPSKITVLCSYRGQVQEIRNHFRSTKLAALEDITVTTIDSFQGQEDDIILISLVRSNSEGKIGYLSSRNRLCVAISRARCGLYLFGNHTHLANASSKGWKIVSKSMQKKKCLGRRFPFCLSGASIPPRQDESQFDGSSPARERESIRNITYITAHHANINIGGDGSVNTINTNPEAPPSTTTLLPPPFEMQSPGSWTVPVRNPASPPPEYPGDSTPTPEEGPPTKESTQEASTPIEETRSHNLEKESPTQGTHDIQDFEKFDKERPVQETEGPHKGVDLSEGKPLQETGSSEIGAENSKEDPVPTQETMAAGKGPFEETGQDEEKALEETETPSKTQGLEEDETKEKEFLPEDISGEKNSQQETRSPEVDTKDENLPTQETMAAGKGPFEETGLEVGVKGHPTDELE